MIISNWLMTDNYTAERSTAIIENDYFDQTDYNSTSSFAETQPQRSRSDLCNT